VLGFDGEGDGDRHGQRNLYGDHYEIDFAEHVAGQRNTDAPPIIIHPVRRERTVERREESFDRQAENQAGARLQRSLLEFLADARGEPDAEAPYQSEIVPELIGRGGAAELG